MAFTLDHDTVHVKNDCMHRFCTTP
jgi:hypothetical protein